MKLEAILRAFYISCLYGKFEQQLPCLFEKLDSVESVVVANVGLKSQLGSFLKHLFKVSTLLNLHSEAPLGNWLGRLYTPKPT